jgi:DNA-binding protein HU-beta
MNKSEFAKALAGRTDMTVSQAAHVTDHFLDLLKEGVNKGERIAFLGFGTFSVAKRAARTGVNPRNPTQKVKIPARKVVRFTPGTPLKDAANGKFKPLKKAAATAKKDVKKAGTAARSAEKKVAATAKKDVKKVTATAKKATTTARKTAAKAPAKAAPKKRK